MTTQFSFCSWLSFQTAYLFASIDRTLHPALQAGLEMARYVFRNGIFVDRQTGAPMEKPFAGQIVMPNVMSDIPEYRSPVDGALIGSRSQRRDDLKKHNCVEYEPSLSPTKGKFRNPDFCQKRGLQVSEEFR